MADDAIKLPIEPELNMSRLDSQAKAAGKRLSDGGSAAADSLPACAREDVPRVSGRA